MTRLALTLAVGIVIDDAIVVLVNIFRHMGEEGAPSFQTSFDGTREVTPASSRRRCRWDQRSDMNSIGDLMVPSSRGQAVRVDNVATLERGLGPTIIQRFNRPFSMAILADVKPGQPLDAALAAADQVKQCGDRARALNRPPGYSFRFGGQSKLLDETTNNMILALGLASDFIYIVLAKQFESFVQPLVVMTGLPCRCRLRCSRSG